MKISEVETNVELITRKFGQHVDNRDNRILQENGRTLKGNG